MAETTPPGTALPEKRKLGRPAGSKNTKKRRIDDETPRDDVEKRGPGRPRGTGSRQRARAEATALARKKEIKWKEGVPLRIPGVRPTSTPQNTKKSDASTAFEPPQPPSTHELSNTPTTEAQIPKPRHDRQSVVDRVQNLTEAETEPEAGDCGVNGQPNNIGAPINVVDDVDNDSLLESFISEGLGDDYLDGDDDDDNVNVNVDGEPSDRNKNQRKPFPSWLKKVVEQIIDELDTDRKGLRGQSRHYMAGTFWIPQKDVWFLLKKQDINPTDTFLPKFFLWDPADLLGASGIPCPNCSCTLTRDGIIKRPRRVIDIDSCFWMIGYSYKCRKTGASGCDTRFRSWDSRILAKLPRPLAMEFPARLTWRSAISWRAFGIVRSCIQHGMGTSQVAEMFRMQHLYRYDVLRLQYLHTKTARMNLLNQHYEPFLPFDDCSERGFHGFTPSGQWLRDVYDDVMEGHRDSLNQHTAMLSARVCAIDHSHKLAKQVFKVNGVPIFTALLTVTNEKGEIRVCMFVATKSHSQYVEALRKMSEDLTLYGHSQPELFYTDNMSDKGMLESIFTSLLDDVVAVEKHSHLPKFSLPPTVPQVLDSVTEINNVLRGILDEIPPSGHIVVGFDSEWNLETSPMGHIVGRSPPSVIQIAYRDQVYILQISEMLASQRLPHELLIFLKEDRVIKAGRLVTGDLRQLAIAAGKQPTDFKGGLDLATYAKEKLLISNARASLADLTAVILGKYLPKPQAERISSNWSNRELSAEQIDYAARDAYVSLCLYNEMHSAPSPSPLPPSLLDVIGRHVVVMTEDHKKIAARGIISEAVTSSSIDNINISPSRAVISIQEVLIPGTIVSLHNRRSMQEMGPPPFNIVIHRTHVRMINSHANDNSTTPDHNSSHSPYPQPLPLPNVSSEPQLEGDSSDDIVSDGVPVVDEFDSPIGDSENSGGIDDQEPDSDSQRLGADVLGPQNLEPEAFKTAIRSRVLKDIFHVFHMLYISRTHPLRRPFARSLRDALLVPHPDDKARVEAWLRTKNLDWDHMLRYNSEWLWRHCRRTIPPAEVLYPLVHDLFMTWGPLKDAKTDVPLFNKQAWKTAKNILELIRNGYISDPPNVALYHVIGLDKKSGGLPIYRCIRGTTIVEGGVHTHLRKLLPSCSASVGTFNSSGEKFKGHDSIWLSNEIQELEITLSTVYSTPPLQLSWVNGNLYQKTEETMGLTPILESVRIEAGMEEFVEETDGGRKQAYLAKLQGTRRPVLPVHTPAEWKLFSRLMRDSYEFRSSKTSIKMSAVKIWNRHAETEADIFYKLEEQLSSHFNGKWQDMTNSAQSVSLAKPFTDPLEKRVNDPGRSNEIINVPSTEMSRHRVTEGFMPVSPQATSSHSLPNNAIQNFADANPGPEWTKHEPIWRNGLKNAKTVLVHVVAAQMGVVEGSPGTGANIRAETVAF
ncbi:hypothetical protein H0H93_003585 [Arthromyces matolae]|nr:hypothetical protein H0H93_003585 [Arthromyces matolae]